MRYIYLHGFASGPASEKAAFLRQHFEDNGLTLETPTLVPGEFSQLTITGKLNELKRVIDTPSEGDASSSPPAPKETPAPRLSLLASSLGGYVATLYAAHHPENIERLILLAPAFGFPTRWLQRAAALPANPDDPDCSLTVLDAWQQTGFHTVYHHEKGQDDQIGYQLVTDAEQYPDFPVVSPDIPILILHGKNDETVPLEYARSFLELNPHTKLVTLDADHRLTDPAILAAIWQETQDFISPS